MLNTWKDKLGFGKDKNLIISAPMEGNACSLSEVNDPVFKDKILGDGMAIRPSRGRVVAPVDGTVVLLFETKHAITLRSEQGTEILIHIGLDTVKLSGEYFTSYVKTNDIVKTGDLLLEFDMEKIEKAGYDLISPIVICNTSAYSEIITYTGNSVKELDKVMMIKNKRNER
jgi:PTS system beta-glucosides-specific IIC component